MLAGDSRSSRLGCASLGDDLLVLEGCELGAYTALSLLLIVVAELAVLSWEQVVLVLLRQDLLCSDRLDGGVVMVLVNLTVDGGCDLLVLNGLDNLLDDGGVNDLVHLGDGTAVTGDVLDCLSSGVHVCGCLSVIGWVGDDC